MNDKKLHAFRRTPDEAYADALYQRLNRLPQIQTAPPQPQYGRSRRRRLAWAFAILLAGLLVMAAVPGVRARFEDVIKRVGALTIFMTEDYPGGKYEPTIIEDDIVTLDEARERADFEFALPGWVPDGLTLQADEIRFSNVVDGVTINWVDDTVPGRAINIKISEAMPDVQYIVGPDSMTEITLNGEPAAFIRGGWFANSREWEDNGLRSIRWQINGTQYHLSTGSEATGGITDEELIKVAESIIPVESQEEGSSIRPAQ